MMSYATVEQANQYFANIYNSSWDRIATPDKQKLLSHASLNIDKMDFRGRKLDKEQINEFPRKFLDGSISDENKIIAACCEEAIAIYDNEGINLNQNFSMESFSLGDLSIKKATGVSNFSTQLFGQSALLLLKPYLKSTTSKVLL